MMFMNMAHNKLKSNLANDSYDNLVIHLGIPSHIANLTQLQTLNLTNNHLEVHARFWRNIVSHVRFSF